MNKSINILLMIISYIISLTIFIQLNKKCSWFQEITQKIKSNYEWQLVVGLMSLVFIISIIFSEFLISISMILNGSIIAFILYIRIYKVELYHK
ncbi:hypothetical protein [Clostridium chauvoei]|uniref:Uncharacterized protein n=2 Tax=Clostridium chauvoei TaxID=46867 RepID=A0A1U6J114_9CLOT|nr:hypothetical protein [Clostridium chauvoei]ATD54351.1 hypothetical protein BTM20_03525 [Clostridium chauvoei]ATD57965.1 hypothetical protein BTM21_09535 [Clostridium chauvoei]MBX7279759.1 hypothetical protein [Clostridium chauvoei]MBX7282128.1 hypothetical protein [Clostridium chauvoei]MBX7284650.1 hypothetical protein [Clostridium chauvoei]